MDKKLKIAIFTDAFFPYASGVTTSIYNHITRLAKKGHEVIVFYPYSWKKHTMPEFSSNIKLVPLRLTIPIKKFKDFSIALPSIDKCVRHIKRFKPDVIHCQTEIGIGWAGLMCAKFFDVPLLGHYHTFFADPLYLKKLGVPNNFLTRKFAWKFSITFFNRCDYILTPTSIALSELKSNGLKKDGRAFSNGIPFFEKRSNEFIKKLKKKYGLDKTFNIITIGRLSPEKSPEIILKAFRIFNVYHPKSKLIIVGDGPAMKKTKKYIEKKSLSDSVLLLGKVPYDELMGDNYYRLGDVFAVSSKTETQGLTILEAMSQGLPIIGVDKYALPEVILNEKNGYLVEPDNYIKMSKAFYDIVNLEKEKFNNMKKVSLSMASEHHIDKINEDLEKFYYKFIKESPRNPNYVISLKKLNSLINKAIISLIGTFRKTLFRRNSNK